MHHLTEFVTETKPKVHEGPLGGPDSQYSGHLLPLPWLAQMVKNLPAMWKTLVQPLVQEDPLENEMATCLENSMDRGAW